MPKDMLNLPVLGREATVVPGAINKEERTVDVVWTTGAKVRRARWEGWDTIVEYDEELIVSPNAVRLERLNDGAPFLESHRSWGLDSVLGNVVPDSVQIEGGEGRATIRLTSAPDAESVIHRILEGSVNKVSVGYRVHKYEIEKRDGERELWRAVDWEPYEISAVAMPADPGASIRSDESEHERLHPCAIIRRTINPAPAGQQKGHTMPKKKQAADGAAENGRATDTIEQRSADVTNGAARSSESSETTPQVASATDNSAIEAERQRASEILTLCKRHGLDDRAEDMIKRGISLDAARAEILDHLAAGDPFEGRTAVPAQTQSSGETEIAYRDAATTAIMHRADPGNVEMTSDAREFRGMSLLEQARHILERGGVSTRGMSRMELASAAFQSRAGAMGTSDFPAILANVANKTLRRAYEATPRTFAMWARRTTISDFKPVNRTQIAGAPDLRWIAENAEYSYGAISDGKETYNLATYGRIVAITRQAIINDDLDALTRIPASFGAAAADLESDLVYAILTGNPNMADGTALFHADHGNLGTAAAVTEAALGEAYKLFGKQKGLEGRPISVLPSYIITPPGSRAIEARKQVTATTPNSTADVNTFANRLQVVEEPRLIPASGNDPWFLAADTARIDTVEYAYLDGQDGVYTETRVGFEVDGVEIKARHDFATKAIDWRGLFKNPGA
ncbi:prohead protease/major capsid protein fusion protein [Profundibacter sp.]